MNMIKALSRKFIFLSLLLALPACWNPITNPKPPLLKTEMDVGPPEYRQGYNDGCQTGLSAYGTTYMKSVYAMKKTARYANDRMYNQAWKDAWNYCYMFMFMIRSDDSIL